MPEIVPLRPVRVKLVESRDPCPEPKRNLHRAKAARFAHVASVRATLERSVGASILISSVKANAKASLAKWQDLMKKMQVKEKKF